MIRLKKWEELPEFMQNDEVREYYNLLKNKSLSIFLKRCFDLIVGIIVAIILLPFMIIIACMIKLDSPGKIIFKQERVTLYGKKFQIYKFRTMVENAESIGSQVTVQSDSRITRVGKLLRKIRIDEFPQVFNVIAGQMSFVGTRPETEKYVKEYTSEMKATLLLPAGITSMTSIFYKDEERLLSQTTDADFTYIRKILPDKMKYNLRAIKEFSFFNDIKTMILTVLAVSVGVKNDNYIEKEEVQNV